MWKILTIGISRPSKFHCFWAVMDQKRAQSWCKTIKCQTISSISWLLSQKYWFLSLKKGKVDMVKMCVTPKLTHQFWRIFNNVADFFWSRCLQQVLIQVSRQYEKNSSVRKILIIGISRPSKFHGFWTFMDQKMAQSLSKIMIGQRIFSINCLLV